MKESPHTLWAPLMLLSVWISAAVAAAPPIRPMEELLALPFRCDQPVSVSTKTRDQVADFKRCVLQALTLHDAGLPPDPQVSEKLRALYADANVRHPYMAMVQMLDSAGPIFELSWKELGRKWIDDVFNAFEAQALLQIKRSRLSPATGVSQLSENPGAPEMRALRERLRVLQRKAEKEAGSGFLNGVSDTAATVTYVKALKDGFEHDWGEIIRMFNSWKAAVDSYIVRHAPGVTQEALPAFPRSIISSQ